MFVVEVFCTSTTNLQLLYEKQSICCIKMHTSAQTQSDEECLAVAKH